MEQGRDFMSIFRDQAVIVKLVASFVSFDPLVCSFVPTTYSYSKVLSNL